MNCKEKRSIFNLFKVHNCNSCDYLRKDEEYYIGNTRVNIYYSNNGCKEINIINNEDLTYYNPKISLFLKDAIVNRNDIIFLWIDDIKEEEKMDLIEHLLGFDLDIHIMINY